MFCIYKIYAKLIDYKEADAIYKEIRDIDIESNQKYSNTDSDSESNKALVNINNDYKFWINIENTNIDYPVVQGDNNSYYLNHDFYNNKSSSGTPFIDYRNDYSSDKNIVIYGHNMKNNTMFSELEKFKKEDFFKTNNKIKLTIDSVEFVYEVFSVYITDGQADYITVDFEDSDMYKSYIQKIEANSMYSYKNSIDETDKIITLSTCSYEYNDARTVVHAKLIN